MDKTTAQRIVCDTCKAPFDKGRYRNLINELCSGFDEGKAQTMRVPDAFAPHRIGETNRRWAAAPGSVGAAPEELARAVLGLGEGRARRSTSYQTIRN